MNSINQQTAQTIAIAGLSRLAGDDELLMRFCGVTGILPNDIRQASGQPGFLAGVLDFYLAHEPDLLAWAQADELRPESIVAARQRLSPNDQSEFE